MIQCYYLLNLSSPHTLPFPGDWSARLLQELFNSLYLPWSQFYLGLLMKWYRNCDRLYTLNCWIVSTEAICKNFCNLTWNWLIKKNELQDYLLHSQEKVQVILLRSFPNESPNKEEFEFIILFLSYVRYCRYMLITDVTTKRFFGLFLMKSSRENTFLV